MKIIKNLLMKQKSMQKKCIKIRKIIICSNLIIILISVIFASCNKQVPNKDIKDKIVLEYDSALSKLYYEKFKFDSLLIERMNSDSMIIYRYLEKNDNYWYSTFSLIENIFYEHRVVPHLIIEGETETSIILIPTFLQRDTTFYYLPEDDFFPVSANMSFDKCRYQIKKNNNEFIFIKQSLTDSTYKEIFFYDKNYNINKFINTWQDNECVYVIKD
jgi:hypothetical protein